MDIQLNDWDFDDLKTELRNMTLTQIQEKFIQNDKELSEKCVLYLKSKNDKQIQKECDKLYQEKLIIAVEIADKLTGIESTL